MSASAPCNCIHPWLKLIHPKSYPRNPWCPQYPDGPPNKTICTCGWNERMPRAEELLACPVHNRAVLVSSDMPREEVSEDDDAYGEPGQAFDCTMPVWKPSGIVGWNCTACGELIKPPCQHTVYYDEEGNEFRRHVHNCTAPPINLAIDPNFEVTNDAIRAKLNAMAKRLDVDIPKGWGFTLLLYEFDPGSALFYISNAKRADMIKTMRECVKMIGPN